MMMETIAGAVLMLALPAAVHGPERPRMSAPVRAEQQAAAAVVDAFHAALKRGDRQAAAMLMASDTLIYESGGVERSKAEYEADHLAADAAFAQAVRRAVTRRHIRSNGSLAWVASETSVKGTYKAQTIDRVSTETMILRHSGSKWRIVHIHWSSADVK